MRKKYYLIREHGRRGSCYIGTNGSGFPKELREIPKGFCYTSEKKALTIAQKWNGKNLYASYSVIEVPIEALIDGEHYLSPECMEFAHQLLAKHGCPMEAYRGVAVEEIVKDLRIEYPKKIGNFEHLEIARCLRRIGDSVPEPPKAPFKMVWDNINCVDSTEHDSFEAAKEAAFDTLLLWMVDCDLTYPQNAEEWDYMISNCSVCVRRLNQETDEYEDFWEPTYEDEAGIGWVEWTKRPDHREDVSV